MAVNLQKGQRVNLKKADGQALHKVMIGLGWDPVDGLTGVLKHLLNGAMPHDIDCDASVLMCINGKVVDRNRDVVYYGHLKHASGSVRHMGDNLTGSGKGDDEQIFIDLDDVPADYDKLVFIVNIYHAASRRQHFGMIDNAFIRIVDDDGTEFCRYDLNEKYEDMTAMIVGELYRRNGEWKFNAIGQATRDDSIDELVNRYR